MNTTSNSLLTLHFDVRGALLDSARECEEEVFLQAFGNRLLQFGIKSNDHDANFLKKTLQLTDYALKDFKRVFSHQVLLVKGRIDLGDFEAADLFILNQANKQTWRVRYRRLQRCLLRLDLRRTNRCVN